MRAADVRHAELAQLITVGTSQSVALAATRCLSLSNSSYLSALNSYPKTGLYR